MLRAVDVEVGVRGQRITVRGSAPPSDGRTYSSEQELELDLSLARELYRLLGKLIPLAEKSKPPSTVVTLDTTNAA